MISIIIAARNEDQCILNKTLVSILRSSPPDIEIIVVDDNSNVPIVLDENIHSNVILKRNTSTIGASQSKHLGVCLSKYPYIFLTDAHVLFDKNWYDRVLESVINNPYTLWCGSCLGLDIDNFDLAKSRGKYTGAQLFLYNIKDKQILDGKWTTDKKNDNNYEISCVMGANYFMHKNWFFKIRGYGDLKGWGSEEPCLSIKTWLSGGEVRINKDVKIGHLFRNLAPYQTNMIHLLYNKIRMAKSFCPTDMEQDLISKLYDYSQYHNAAYIIERENTFIQEYKKYYQGIFTKDIHWLLKKFNIQYEC